MFTLASERLRRADDESADSGLTLDLLTVAEHLENEDNWLQTPANFEQARLASQAIPSPRADRVAEEAAQNAELTFCQALSTAMNAVVRHVQQEKTPDWAASAKMLVYLMSEMQRKLVEVLCESGAKSRKEDVKRVKHIALCAETLLEALVTAASLEEFDTDQDENRDFAECILGSFLEFSKIFIGKNAEKTLTAPLNRIISRAIEALVHTIPLFRATEFVAGRLTTLCGTHQTAAEFTRVTIDKLGNSSEVASTTISKMLQLDYTDTKFLKDQVEATTSLLGFCAKHGNLHWVLRTEPNLTLLLDLLDAGDYRIRIAAIYGTSSIVGHLLNDGLTAENVESIELLLEKLCLQSTDVNALVRRSLIRALDELCEPLFMLRRPRLESLVIKVASDRVRDRNSLVRQAAIGLFCQVLLHNMYINDPSVEQSQYHLDSATFSKQLKEMSRMEDQLKAELETVLAELGRGVKREPELEEDADANLSLADASFDVLSAARARGDVDGASRATAAREAYLQANQSREWIEEAKAFALECEGVIEWSQKLLYSPLASDQLSLIQLFEHGETLRIQGYVQRRNALLHLAWLKPDADDMGPGTSRSGRVSTKLTEMFYRSWLGGDTPRAHALSLVQVVEKAEHVQLLSMKKILETMIQSSVMPAESWEEIVEEVWALFENGSTSSTKDYQLQASEAQLLAFFAEIDSRYAKDHLDLIFAMPPPQGSDDPKLCNYAVYTHCCEIIRHCADDLDEEIRIDYIQKLGGLLLRPSNSLSWFGFAHQGLHALVKLKDIHALTALIKRFGKVLSSPSDLPSTAASQDALPRSLSPESRQFVFAQMMYIVGDAMLHTQVELDSLNGKFKAAVLAESGKRAAALAQRDAEDDQDLVLQRQTADFQFKTQIEMIRKTDTLKSKLSLFELFAPKLKSIAGDIVYNEKQAREDPRVERYSPFLQAAVTSALSKFMTADLEFCKDNMPCLIALLNEADSEDLKSTVMVAIGDNAAQNGFVTESYIPAVFEALRQQNTTDTVKRTTTAVLTFLILGGKVKIRGKLGKMANLLVDDNPKIRALARIFFGEFAKKDNDFVNSFMDIYSSVAKMVGPQLPVKKAQEIFTFLSTLFRSVSDRLNTLIKMKGEFFKIAQRSLDNKSSGENEFAVFKTCAEMIAKIPGKSEDDDQEEPVAAAVAPTPAGGAAGGTAGDAAVTKKLSNLLDHPDLKELKKGLAHRSFLEVQREAQQKADADDLRERGDDEYNTTAAADRSVRRTSSRIRGAGIGTILEDVESEPEGEGESEMNEVEEHAN